MAKGTVTGRNRGKIGTRTNPSINVGGGSPPTEGYGLPFFGSGNIIGCPWYHFRSDWNWVGSQPNFTNIDGNLAKPGDRVKEWHNVCIGGGTPLTGHGFNNAFVPTAITQLNPVTGTEVVTGGNYWGKNGYPQLENVDYDGTLIQGLRFNGTTYLQVEGGELSQHYGGALPDFSDPLFKIGGTNNATGNYKNTGATFMFIIDPNDEPPRPFGEFDNIQALLYSRLPCCGTTPTAGQNGCQTLGVAGFPYYGNLQALLWYEWPTTEHYGAQIFFQGATTDSFPPPTPMPTFGPQAIVAGNCQSPWSNNPTRDCCWTGPDSSPYYCGTPPGQAGYNCNKGAYWPGNDYIRGRRGLQMWLVEYSKESVGPSLPTGSGGPTVGTILKFWGMSRTDAGAGTATYGYPDPETPTFTTADNPMVAAPWTLLGFNSFFIGGMPPVLSNATNPTQYGHGFRGMMFEFLGIEAVLTLADKKVLFEEIATKYGKAIVNY